MEDTLENIELRTEEVREILTRVPHWMLRYGNILFFCLIIGLLSLTWYIKYPDTINSSVIITTKIPPQKEYAKINGNIYSILVSDNQNVNPNQPLAILENTANYKDVFQLKKVIDTISINNDSFFFPLEQVPVFFLGDIQTQYTLFENNYIQYLLNKDLKPYTHEILANTVSNKELNKRLLNLIIQRDVSKTELNLVKKDLNRSKLLFDKKVISKSEFENKQIELLVARQNLKQFEFSISQTKEDIENSKNRLKSSEINNTKMEITSLKSTIQSFNILKKAIKDWENTYVLKSKINGNVTFLDHWSSNQTVNKGDLVFTIIPSANPTFIAKLKTPTLNSGKIKRKQHVNIKLENYPENEFGILNGIIENISLIPDKDNLYSVDVKISNELITSYNKKITFKQEMRGAAEIVTEDLRLIERILYQFRAIFSRP